VSVSTASGSAPVDTSSENFARTSANASSARSVHPSGVEIVGGGF
jgi:hypothetical protein